MFLSLIPVKRKTEFIAFHTTFVRSPSFIGPLVFGVVSDHVGYKWAIGSNCLYLLLALFALLQVDVEAAVMEKLAVDVSDEVTTTTTVATTTTIIEL